MSVLQDLETIKNLGNILKTNVSACLAIGTGFVVQLGRIYLDMLNLYKTISGFISDQVAQQGEIVTKTPVIRAMRVVKKETLRLIDTFVQKSEELQLVIENIVPPLFEIILADYTHNVPQARDAEVMTVIATLVAKLSGMMTGKVPAILGAIFECTLDMINKDFSNFPEHRVAFFKLLQAINANCFSGMCAFLAIPLADQLFQR